MIKKTSYTLQKQDKERFYNYIKKQKLSMRQTAYKSNITYSNLCAILNGKRPLTENYILRLNMFLNCDVLEIFNGSKVA